MSARTLLFISVLYGLLCSCHPGEDNLLTIAIASNAQHALTPIVEQYEAMAGVRCQVVVASSGKLTSQIIQGAPYDVFLSADISYPSRLYRDSLTVGAPQIYAYGQLVLWSGSYYSGADLYSLNSDEIKHVAIANPDIAPYGKAAVEALQYYRVYDDVEDKLVYGESVSQAAQFAVSGAAEVCLIAKSLATSPEMSKYGAWISIDTAAYHPIVQGAVVLRRSDEETTSAQDFVAFLQTPVAQQVLRGAGYRLP